MVVDAEIVVVSVTVIKCGFSGGRDLNSDWGSGEICCDIICDYGVGCTVYGGSSVSDSDYGLYNRNFRGQWNSSSAWVSSPLSLALFP
jgi:hypothetical protein